MKASSNFFNVKALLVSKTKQTFQKRHFSVVSRKTDKAFILLLKVMVTSFTDMSQILLKPTKILKIYTR